MRIFLSGMLMLAGCTLASAAVLTTTWAPDGSLDGTGVGNLGGVTVTYSTVVGVPTAGTSQIVNWDTSLATAPEAPYTDPSAGTLGGSGFPLPVTEAITFSAPVTDPILLVIFADSNGSMNFGALSLTFLSSNNAQLSFGQVTFNGATGTADDGFAAQINGTFGPGNPIVFNYSSGVLRYEQVAFSVGVGDPIPEPWTGALLPIGLAATMLIRRKIAR